MKNNFKKALSFLYLDFFAFRPAIPFNGKREHKSWLTILLTYAHIALIILAFVVFGKELILKENPNLIITEKRVPLDEPFEFNFNSNQIPISFGLFIGQRLISWDKRYFNVYGEQRTYIRKTKQAIFSIKKTIFEMGKCPLNYVAANFGENLTKEELNYFSDIPICMSNKVISTQVDNSTTILQESGSHTYLKGFFGSTNFTVLYIKYARCTNSTDPTKPICASSEEIEAKLKDLYLGTKVYNNYLNPKSFESPINQNYEWAYGKAPHSNAKQKILLFQKNILRSGIGVVTESEKVEEYFALSSNEEQSIVTDDGEEDYFFSFCMMIDNIEKTYTRRYKQLQDVFAQVGGLVKTLLIFATLIVRPLLERKFKLEFLESVFEEALNEAQTEKNDKISLTIRKDIKNTFKNLESLFDVKKLILHVNYMEKLLKIIFDDQQRALFKNGCKSNLTNLIVGIHPDFRKSTFNKADLRKLMAPKLVQKSFEKSLSNVGDEDATLDERVRIFNIRMKKISDREIELAENESPLGNQVDDESLCKNPK